jgi:hypothetical protein
VDSPSYLAQSAGADCRPGDSSIVCCIKKFPLTPVESCGATAAEVAEILNGVKVLNEAVQPTGEESAAPADEARVEEDDFANNADLPEWKQECIKFYVDCQNKEWTGSCYECIRRCEGQHEWPFSLCAPPGKKR